MLRDSLLRPWLITLICVALVWARVSGAHLHLCFDGNEAPVTFYLADKEPHHEGAGAKIHHQDSEKSAIGDVVSKTSKSSFDLPLFLLTALLFWSAFQLAPRFNPSFTATARPLTVPYLRPPLRGPPLLASQ